MKLIDFEKVQKLIKQRNNCLKALDQCANFIADIEIEGSEYLGKVNKYSDGSGASIDLDGCHVIMDVVKATREILVKKVDEVDSQLKELGVE